MNFLPRLTIGANRDTEVLDGAYPALILTILVDDPLDRLLSLNI